MNEWLHVVSRKSNTIYKILTISDLVFEPNQHLLPPSIQGLSVLYIYFYVISIINTLCFSISSCYSNFNWSSIISNHNRHTFQERSSLIIHWSLSIAETIFVHYKEVIQWQIGHCYRKIVPAIERFDCKSINWYIKLHIRNILE